jgi:hypothetical protein
MSGHDFVRLNMRSCFCFVIQKVKVMMFLFSSRQLFNRAA